MTSKSFSEVKNLTQLNLEEFMEKIESPNECTMSTIISGLKSNIFGQFSGSLLDVKLTVTDLTYQIVSIITKHNILCLRFLQLFEVMKNSDMNHLPDALDSDVGCLLALLDASFNFDSDDKKIVSDRMQEIRTVVDNRGYNLLMVAVETTLIEADSPFPFEINTQMLEDEQTKKVYAKIEDCEV